MQLRLSQPNYKNVVEVTQEFLQCFPVQFLNTYNMQNRGEPGPINDANVYLGRQRWESFPNQINSN